MQSEGGESGISATKFRPRPSRTKKMTNKELSKELGRIADGLKDTVLMTQDALDNIKKSCLNYADFLEYMANRDEIDHAIDYAAKEGYLDIETIENLKTEQDKLRIWKKLEADSIRGEMMAEDCLCEPDKMCENCQKEEVESH